MALLQIPVKAKLATFRAKVSTNLNLGFFNINGQFVDTTIPLKKSVIYLLTDITFVTNAKEGDFIEGLSDPANPADPATEIIVWIKRNKTGGQPVNRWPFRFNIYKREWDAQIFFPCRINDDFLRMEVSGIIRQTPGMVLDGISRLDTIFNASVYEIEEKGAMKRYYGDP